MKSVFIILCITVNMSIAMPCIADESLANGTTENVAGDTIVILDGQNSAEQATAGQNTESQSWHEKAQEILINAMSLTGIKYTYGGKSPETVFDCSGFVRYVFSQAANLTLPPTARAISQIGKTIKKDELQPGDLVFFNTLKKTFSHVGIYIGNNKFIHAPSTGNVVRIESMQTGYWASHFNGGQRLDKESAKDATKN